MHVKKCGPNSKHAQQVVFLSPGHLLVARRAGGGLCAPNVAVSVCGLCYGLCVPCAAVRMRPLWRFAYALRSDARERESPQADNYAFFSDTTV